MLIFLYFCTGFALATVLVSLAHVVAFTWHGARARVAAGTSANVRGRQLQELIVAWGVLGFSTSVVILLASMYP